MVDDTLDPPSTGSNLFEEKGPELQLHPLDIAEVVLARKAIPVLELIPITDDLDKSL